MRRVIGEDDGLVRGQRSDDPASDDGGIGLVGLDSSHAEDFLRHINIEAQHAQMRITALYGTDDARLAGLEPLDGSLVPYPTLGSLIENVDAVIVGHRDGALHRDAAIACLKARRPVFVDKPLANSRRDAEAMVAAAEQSGVPLLSGSAFSLHERGAG